MDPEYLLVLSGDHIYKMDYEDMLAKHKKSNAALSVAVIDVPWDEASRFGIMNTDENDRIIEFEEKPENQRATSRFDGIYIFTWARLRDVLLNSFKKTLICMILVKMLFHFTLRVGIMCRLITSRATGKMLGRSILYGQRIWNLSTMKVI